MSSESFGRGSELLYSKTEEEKRNKLQIQIEIVCWVPAFKQNFTSALVLCYHDYCALSASTTFDIWCLNFMKHFQYFSLKFEYKYLNSSAPTDGHSS